MTADGITFQFRPHELSTLGDDEVRIAVEFGAPKHGTEGHALAGSVFNRKQWDAELRLFRPRPDAERPAGSASTRERPVGNVVVGRVTAVGGGVSAFRPGDRVFGYSPLREVATIPSERVASAEGLTDLDAVCTDPAHVALVAVRDGQARLGDAVAIFGLGAIGLFAVRMAMLCGAHPVFAIDPIASRREAALALGSTRVIDPGEQDAAVALREATGRCGVDVAIETSGAAVALQEAVRSVRQCGTVVHVPWGPGDCAALHLDEEFHLNRPTLVASQAVWQNPDRDHPRWDEGRARSVVVDLFRRGLLSGDAIVRPIVDFEQAPAALAACFRDPSRAIKIGVRFAA